MHISETEVVALIAVVGTLGSGGLSYLASRRNTDVQIDAIQAEMEQLRAGHREEGRRERQDAYYGFITAIDAIPQYVFGVRGEVTEEGYVELIKDFGDEHTRIMFLGSDEVLAAVNPMLGAFSAFTTAAVDVNEAETVRERLKEAFDAHADSWTEAKLQLLTAMKEDIDRHKDSA
jgi:hypothetical protein